MIRFMFLSAAVLCCMSTRSQAQNLTQTPNLPAQSTVNTSSFNNSSNNVSGVSTSPGFFTRLYRSVWGSSSSTIQTGSSTFPGPAPTNTLKVLGPLPPIMGTTTSFPIPVVPGTLGPVALPKSGTGN
ncbi:hypothetical protein KIH39_05595 [Telmatocola sphagniphila]|uniref:Uncharacterized protein n=1 Tax=Telmatocola sphagniphila TaxID=1123043 RepID=A0A8E6B7M2_9BACT|nr:hypothetical protein [Telmatocola sphagniphila]QVL33387.1 hypothetical protein KIH39_05595 [Telmatocola sphagniphila]